MTYIVPLQERPYIILQTNEITIIVFISVLNDLDYMIYAECYIISFAEQEIPRKTAENDKESL